MVDSWTRISQNASTQDNVDVDVAEKLHKLVIAVNTDTGIFPRAQNKPTIPDVAMLRRLSSSGSNGASGEGDPPTPPSSNNKPSFVAGECQAAVSSLLRPRDGSSSFYNDPIVQAQQRELSRINIRNSAAAASLPFSKSAAKDEISTSFADHISGTCQETIQQCEMISDILLSLDSSEDVRENTIVQEYYKELKDKQRSIKHFMSMVPLNRESLIDNLLQANDKLTEAFQVYFNVYDTHLVWKARQASQLEIKEPTATEVSNKPTSSCGSGGKDNDNGRMGKESPPPLPPPAAAAISTVTASQANNEGSGKGKQRDTSPGATDDEGYYDQPNNKMHGS
ncbi:hypothetical protein EV182_000892 [Spiromyces aspiralis]|uniref:Uncharacterized protein n=1 Tax=Spiromyces aspiralis TaxID=68401 RepID=A0ACC1HZY3_9FUNG|nr:hypothetical protein EV182_000892 [Spiromyces aspiralis]